MSFGILRTSTHFLSLSSMNSFRSHHFQKLTVLFLCPKIYRYKWVFCSSWSAFASWVIIFMNTNPKHLFTIYNFLTYMYLFRINRYLDLTPCYPLMYCHYLSHLCQKQGQCFVATVRPMSKGQCQNRWFGLSYAENKIRQQSIARHS